MKNTRVTKNNLRNVVLTLTLTSVLQSCLLSSSSDKPYAAAPANGANSCAARTMASANMSMDKDHLQNNDDLFEDVTNTNFAFRTNSENANNQIADHDDTPTRQVRIHVGQFKQRLLNRRTNKFHLPLLNNRSVNIILQDVKKYSDNNIVATGRIDGDDLSDVTLVINNDVITANVGETGTQESYEIRFSGNGIHTVKAVTDHSEDCLTVDGENAQNFLQPLNTEAAAEDVTALDAVPTIDVLVAYTPAALKNAGSLDAMKALIQMGVADSNKAYQNSGVNLALRLVGTMALAQSENSFSSDLSALKGTSDGKWDTVHAERKKVGADLVSLVAYYANSSTAGIGFVGSSFSSGFSITKTTAFKQFSFTHELGHNIGLNHTDGYQNASGKFRTVMAYGTYTRIPRFSNPGVDYNSYATGTSSNNSAKLLNTNGAKVAGFSSSVVQSETPTTSDPIPDPTEPCTDTDTPPIASE
ncbi:MAG: M12 family metallo-peptidase [Bdellovibrionota bacterium]